MFAYAASYFRDPDAQYYLARLYLNGTGAPHDPRQAARWFGLSAQKGQCEAQAMLGAMLFEGDHVPRQAARGLMWLALAKDSARPDQAWITKLYDSAMQQASEDERALAAVYLRRSLETRREKNRQSFRGPSKRGSPDFRYVRGLASGFLTHRPGMTNRNYRPSISRST